MERTACSQTIGELAGEPGITLLDSMEMADDGIAELLHDDGVVVEVAELEVPPDGCR